MIKLSWILDWSFITKEIKIGFGEVTAIYIFFNFTYFAKAFIEMPNLLDFIYGFLI